MTIQSTDAEAAANATAPRVSLKDIERAIVERHEFTADKVVDHKYLAHPSLHVFSICLLVVTNGFVVIGKSAPASVDNFNADLGRKFAYEDAIRQLWPLMGFALRDKLSA